MGPLVGFLLLLLGNIVVVHPQPLSPFAEESKLSEKETSSRYEQYMKEGPKILFNPDELDEDYYEDDYYDDELPAGGLKKDPVYKKPCDVKKGIECDKKVPKLSPPFVNKKEGKNHKAHDEKSHGKDLDSKFFFSSGEKKKKEVEEKEHKNGFRPKVPGHKGIDFKPEDIELSKIDPMLIYSFQYLSEMGLFQLFDLHLKGVLEGYGMKYAKDFKKEAKKPAGIWDMFSRNPMKNTNQKEKAKFEADEKTDFHTIKK